MMRLLSTCAPQVLEAPLYGVQLSADEVLHARDLLLSLAVRRPADATTREIQDKVRHGAGRCRTEPRPESRALLAARSPWPCTSLASSPLHAVLPLSPVCAQPLQQAAGAALAPC